MKKILVIGGSIGGLVAANLLVRAGFDVHVFERAAQELEGRGAGIVTHPELMHAITKAGVVVDASIGVDVQERVTLDRQGHRMGLRTEPQTLTAWARLFSVLRAAFPDERYHNGMQLQACEQDEHGVHATFTNGETARGDALIAADGVRSTVRQQLVPDVQPIYAGYVAWRGLVEESVLSPQVLADLFPYFAFGLPPHEQMIAYPVAGRDNTVAPGQRRYNFVWYRPADEASTLRDLLTDGNGKVWWEGIPPPLIRPELLDQARRAAHEVLAPQFAEVVEKTVSLLIQPIYDLESPRMAFGRVALLGDAAFVARPHVGMGVTKAASDAVALAIALQCCDHLPTALASYEAARIGFGRACIERARALGAYMQAQIRTPQEREMAERYRTASAVMRDTAVPFALQ